MRAGFEENFIIHKYGDQNTYQSPVYPASKLYTAFPGLAFYHLLFWGPVTWLAIRGAKGKCDDAAWVYGSAWVGDILEKLGGRIDIQGQDNFRTGGPYVFIANHMSTLETFLLPGILRPCGPVTFVVKKSLTTMPFFGPIMRSRDPIAIGRKNPREDLANVLKGGVERLKKGISIVVFPQSTRSIRFDKKIFNSIGIKLAKAADVPFIPLALKTHAWGQGKKIKEAGRIRPDLPVRFCFGKPVKVTGPGKNEHQQACDFIEETLSRWQAQDGINEPGE